MSLRCIFGLPQSGKTHRIFAEIAEELKNGGQTPLLLIVPEQFSMSAEKKLVSMLPEPAVTRAQALSFQRLAYHLFARAGAAGGFLDDAGKAMLIRKILYDIRGELKYYARAADKAGFAGLLLRQIAEFHRYGVSPEAIARVFPDSPKFADIRLIFERYAEARSKLYSSDDTLTFVPEKLEKSGFYDGASVWVDGFFGFTPQERGVILSLLKRCARVTVSLTLDASAAENREPAGDDFFGETKDTADSLARLAKIAGTAAEPPLFLKREHPSQELDFFINNWRSRRVFRGEARDIRLITAENRREEVRALADEILRLCREGLRYRDIAVISCGPAYDKELRDVFRQYGIPLFMDEKTDLFCHPLTELLRSAVEVCARNRGREGVFRFLKTGLAGVSRDETDILENYVLARGIANYKWDLEWDAPEDTLRAREKLFAALAPFVGALGKGAYGGSGKYPARTICRALADMMDGLDVRAALERREAEIADPEDARRFGQALPRVSGILDIMADILGGEAVTLREFGKILDAGLESADLGVIPPTVDQVLVGDFARSRFPEIKTLIVLGANGDAMSPLPEEGGLLTDDERLAFLAGDVDIAPDGRRRAFYERARVYCGLAKPQKELVLIYREKEAADAVESLKRMFPGLAAAKYSTKDIPPAKPLTERLCAMLGAYARGSEMPEDYAEAYKILRAKPEAAGNLGRLERLVKERAAGKRVSLGREAVRSLYGERLTAGVSRLEKYAECPFSYFMRYNLKAGERKVYEVESVDVGSLFHGVLEAVSRKVAEGERGVSWRGLTEADIAVMVGEAVDELAPAVGNRLFYSTERRKYMLQKVKRICGKSLWALAEHIRRGAFEPLGAEVVFGEGGEQPVSGITLSLNGGRKLVLTGRIDRIDIMDSVGGRMYVKIIDYKTGNVRFSLEDVYLGTQLQLLVYMNALIKNGAEIFGVRAGKKILPGGMFYFNVNDPIVNAGDAGGTAGKAAASEDGAGAGKAALSGDGAGAGKAALSGDGAGGKAVVLENSGDVAVAGKTAISEDSRDGAASKAAISEDGVAGKVVVSEDSGDGAESKAALSEDGTVAGKAVSSGDGMANKAAAIETDTRLRELTLRSFRMSGLALAEPDVISGMDAEASGNSPVVPVYVKKDGSLGVKSSAADRERFEGLLESAGEITKLIGESIFSGEIGPFPVMRGARTGCDFCGYGAVCGFDREGGRYRTKGFTDGA